MNDTVIEVEGLWKRYGLPLPEFCYRWRDYKLARLRRRSRAPGQSEPRAGEGSVNTGSWALRDIGFSVKHGETMGVIGPNGAGKSTLLKVLAGVSPPTRGTSNITGRIFSMIELNAGLHRELTGRENVYLLGAIMGLHRGEIGARMAAIEAYCELGDWFDKPTWQYSSGMLARIGFAVAVNVNADVLLVDEVLAVGDLGFQRRCYDRIAKLKKEGVTILLVSHSMRQVERLCDRVVLLDGGSLLRCGPTVDVVDQYFASVAQREDDEAKSVSGLKEAHIQAADGVALIGVQVLGRDGKACEQVSTGDSIRIRVHVRSDSPLDSAIVSVGFVTTDMLLAGAVSNEFDESRKLVTTDLAVDCVVHDLPLLPGIYSVRLKVRDRTTALLLSADQSATVRVVPAAGSRMGLSHSGLVYLDSVWDVETPLGRELPAGRP